MFPSKVVYYSTQSVESVKKSVKKTKSQNLERNISCPQCGRFFRDNYHLNLHIKIHENRRPHKCSICPKAFVTQSDLKRHLLGHSDATPYKCRVCDKAFKAQPNRKLHEDTHGLNTYKCRFCNEKFKKYMDRSKHELTHKEQQKRVVGDNGKLKFECSYCSNYFASLEFKEKHEASAHKHKKQGVRLANTSPKSSQNTNKLAKKCPACLKNFRSRKELRSHVASSHPEKFDCLFYTNCKICHKKVSTTFINYHTMAHNGVKPHACSVCDAKFPRKSELITHLRVHSNKKAHECSTCQKDFKTLRGLKIHELNHKGISEFKCEYPNCDKAYNTQSKYTSHVRKCHQKYLEKCEICGKETYNIYMKKHIREEHDYEEKLCDHCGITFENEAKLKRHVTSYKYNLKCVSRSIEAKKCSYCSYEGSFKQVKNHCQNKHKEKVFSCCICLHTELTEYLYLKHMRKVHSLAAKEDLKLFEYLLGNKIPEESIKECELCGYIAENHYSLSNHSKCHSNLLSITYESEDNNNILELEPTSLICNRENINTNQQLMRKTKARLQKVEISSGLNNFAVSITKEVSLLCDSFGHITNIKSSTMTQHTTNNLNVKMISKDKQPLEIGINEYDQEETELKQEEVDIKFEEDPLTLPLEPIVSVTELPYKKWVTKKSYFKVQKVKSSLSPKPKSDHSLKEFATDPLITIKGKQFISLEDLQKIRDVNIGTLIDLLKK